MTKGTNGSVLQEMTEAWVVLKWVIRDNAINCWLLFGGQLRKSIHSQILNDNVFPTNGWQRGANNTPRYQFPASLKSGGRSGEFMVLTVPLAISSSQSASAISMSDMKLTFLFAIIICDLKRRHLKGCIELVYKRILSALSWVDAITTSYQAPNIYYSLIQAARRSVVMEAVKTRTNPFSISNILSNNTSHRDYERLREHNKKSDSDVEDGDLSPGFQKMEELEDQTSSNTAVITRTGFCSWTETTREDRKNSSSTRKLFLPFQTDNLQIGCPSYLLNLICSFTIFSH